MNDLISNRPVRAVDPVKMMVAPNDSVAVVQRSLLVDLLPIHASSCATAWSDVENFLGFGFFAGFERWKLQFDGKEAVVCLDAQAAEFDVWAVCSVSAADQRLVLLQSSKIKCLQGCKEQIGK